jgi:hypothetical protein
MSSAEYGRVLEAIKNANSMLALDRVWRELERKHRGDPDLPSMRQMIDLKKARIVSDA